MERPFQPKMKKDISHRLQSQPPYPPKTPHRSDFRSSANFQKSIRHPSIPPRTTSGSYRRITGNTSSSSSSRNLKVKSDLASQHVSHEGDRHNESTFIASSSVKMLNTPSHHSLPLKPTSSSRQNGESSKRQQGSSPKPFWVRHLEERNWFTGNTSSSSNIDQRRNYGYSSRNLKRKSSSESENMSISEECAHKKSSFKASSSVKMLNTPSDHSLPLKPTSSSRQNGENSKRQQGSSPKPFWVPHLEERNWFTGNTSSSSNIEQRRNYGSSSRNLKRKGPSESENMSISEECAHKKSKGSIASSSVMLPNTPSHQSLPQKPTSNCRQNGESSKLQQGASIKQPFWVLCLEERYRIIGNPPSSSNHPGKGSFIANGSVMLPNTPSHQSLPQKPSSNCRQNGESSKLQQGSSPTQPFWVPCSEERHRIIGNPSSSSNHSGKGYFVATSSVMLPNTPSHRSLPKKPSSNCRQNGESSKLQQGSSPKQPFWVPCLEERHQIIGNPSSSSNNHQRDNYGSSSRNLKRKSCWDSQDNSISEECARKKSKMGASISRLVIQEIVVCNICMEDKPKHRMFNKNKCSHSYCSDCIGKHIAAKIDQNIHSVTCPDLNCKTVFDPEECKSLVPKRVFDKWMIQLCESVFPASKKFYCPFKDCSTMLVDDGGEVVTTSECPSCHRLFCAQCKVPWHADKSCSEYQRLIRNKSGSVDDMFLKLAKEKKWIKCPNCKFYVEKRDGCVHMVCRCRFQFCYCCGRKWTDTHTC